MALTPENVATLNGLARDFFRAQLAASPTAIALYRARALDEAAIAHWGLGYAPPTGNALLTHLGKEGWGEATLIEAGLALSTERGAIDFFRNRLMFPIPDIDGTRVLGFGSRRMRDDDESNPKYLNTVETPLFRKRELLYGLPNLAAAKAAGAVFVVEGNFDMLGLHHAGVTNVVAALGTALTLEHLALLRGYVERLDLVLDADPAGQTATLRSLLLEGIEAFDVGVIPLSGGKDPDEIVREDPTAWAGLVAGRIRRWEYLWRRTAAPFEERIGSDVEARVDWKDAWCRLVSEQVADRENGERLLSRLERRLELPAGVLGSEYLLELPAARTEADELLLIALARDWAVRRHAAPLLPLGKAAGAICERWQRTGAPELVGRLAERAGSEGESAELAWTMALRGELGAKIRERIGLLTQMAAGLNGAEELASEARALYTLL